MTEIDVFEDVSNPLDSVEEILCANDWTFDRMNEDELRVQISGKACEYNLYFSWHEDQSAMQFSCDIDVHFTNDNVEMAARTLTAINTSLWLGHFDIDGETNTPRFRHTSLFRGMTYSSGADHIEDLMDIALAECERFHPVFHLLSQSEPVRDLDLGLALMDNAGNS